MSDAANIVLIGDLHMGAGSADPFHRDPQLAAFLTEVAGRRDAAGRPPRLVILGDMFDFLHVPGPPAPSPDATEQGALASLGRIARAHARALDALAGFAAAGGRIDIVVGNHDLELHRPAVRARVRELLGARAPKLTFHPWILHMPGLLYAEHGHQHHDLNALATVLHPFRPGAPEELDLPLGSYLAHHALQVGRVPPARRHAALAAAMGRALAAQMRPRSHDDAALRRHAETVGLSPAALAAIDRVTPRGPAATAARLARHAAGGPRPPADFLHRAARTIHRILEDDDAEVPFYAFGHSHVAEHRALGLGAGAPAYLNAGTWSSLSRGASAPRLRYVEISVRADGPVAHLRRWSEVTAPAARRPRRAADRRGTAPSHR